MDVIGLPERISARVARGRAAATARMTSTVTIRRLTGNTTTVNGYEVPVWEVVHVGIPFRLGSSASGDLGTRAVVVGGVTFQQATAVGSLPWDTTDLRDSDLIDIVSGEWAGSVFRIVEAVKGDQKTARRVPVVEVPRPEEWV